MEKRKKLQSCYSEMACRWLVATHSILGACCISLNHLLFLQFAITSYVVKNTSWIMQTVVLSFFLSFILYKPKRCIQNLLNSHHIHI